MIDERLKRPTTNFLKSISMKCLPRNFIKHYIRPLFKLKQVPYDARKFFESYYGMMVNQEFSDGITLTRNYKPLFVRYHYNAIENSIIEYFVLKKDIKEPHVLDIGSGTGHWIDFYLDVFRAKRVIGIDISKSCVDALYRKYQTKDNVRIIEADISGPNFKLEQKFDIINAVGIMFHIVEDGLWKQAIVNLASHLKDNGIMVIGGQFGWITQNVQFHHADDFSSKDKAQSRNFDVTLVNKRIRSLRHWRKCALEAGLQINSVQRTKLHKRIITPENNILILSHNSKMG